MSHFEMGQVVNTFARQRAGYEAGRIVAVFASRRADEDAYHVKYPDVGTFVHRESDLVAVPAINPQPAANQSTATVTDIEHSRTLRALKDELSRLVGLQLDYQGKQYGRKDAYLEGRIDSMHRVIDIVQRKGL